MHVITAANISGRREQEMKWICVFEGCNKEAKIREDQ